MFRLKSRVRKNSGSDTAVAELAPDFGGSDQELLAEIDRLIAANRANPSRSTERRLLELRNLGGIRLLRTAEVAPEHPEPEYERLPQTDGLPEFTPEEVTPGLLRAGILRDGCLLIRGLVPKADASHFARQIDQSFAERERHDSGEPFHDGYYHEFAPDPRYGEQLGRPWIKEGGGVLAVDSPMLSFEMSEMFRGARLPELVQGYLQEPPLTTAQKTTLRKAEPAVAGHWHQDGKFMGNVRALNLWLSLSRCGDEAPGLDIVPRRLDHFVTTQTDGELLDYTASDRVVEEAAGDKPIMRPIFEPGDALLFDDLFMHKTGSDPAMPKPRFAIESWFFGGSAFPVEYAPLIL
jgi:hypothetical protein